MDTAASCVEEQQQQCHPTTCDGPNEGDCISCPAGFSLQDDDADGFGTCAADTVSPPPPPYDEIVGDAPVPTAHCDTAAIIAHVQHLMHVDVASYTPLDGDSNYEACLAVAKYFKSRDTRLMIVGSCGDDAVCDVADLILWFAGAHEGAQGETVWPPLPQGADAERHGVANALRCVDAQGDIDDVSSQCPGSGGP